ncbi:hypothetical protein R6Q59_018878 [Mikania micrantha]
MDNSHEELEKRHREPAFIPANLMKFYNNTILVENMFVLNRFQIESFDYKEWPNYAYYILIWSDFKILITKHTKLLRFTSDVPRGFRLYPLVPSIMTLTHDGGSTKLIVGERSMSSFELFLQDMTLLRLYVSFEPSHESLSYMYLH